VTNYLQLVLSAGGRAPETVVERLTRAAAILFGRRRRGRK
jgi:hypothetical protein